MMVHHSQIRMKLGCIFYLVAASILLGLAFAETPIASPNCLIACLIVTAIFLIGSSILAVQPCSTQDQSHWMTRKFQGLFSWFFNIFCLKYERVDGNYQHLSQLKSPSSTILSKDLEIAAEELDKATYALDHAKCEWDKTVQECTKAEDDFEKIQSKWCEAKENVNRGNEKLQLAEEALKEAKQDLNVVSGRWNSANEELVKAKNEWNEVNKTWNTINTVDNIDIQRLEKAQDDWNSAKKHLNLVAESWNKANDELAKSTAKLNHAEKIWIEVKNYWEKANEELRQAKFKWNKAASSLETSKIGLQKATSNWNRAREEYDMTCASMKGEMSFNLPTSSCKDNLPMKKSCCYGSAESKMECWSEIKLTAVISVAATLLVFTVIGMILHYFPDQLAQLKTFVTSN